MKASPRQPSLFDAHAPSDDGQAVYARARMREIIELMTATTVPPWKDQMEVILQDGSFKRAMWAVPDQEGQALWAEYDVQMERLYAIWAPTEPAPAD